MEKKAIPMKLEEFIEHYKICALWSSTDEDGTPLGDEKYADAEFSASAEERIRKDCEAFYIANYDDIQTFEYSPEKIAGYDFWLTRNFHGSGFLDGDWDEEVGERLTEAAKKFGECWLFVENNVIDFM